MALRVAMWSLVFAGVVLLCVSLVSVLSGVWMAAGVLLFVAAAALCLAWGWFRPRVRAAQRSSR